MEWANSLLLGKQRDRAHSVVIRETVMNEAVDTFMQMVPAEAVQAV